MKQKLARKRVTLWLIYITEAGIMTILKNRLIPLLYIFSVPLLGLIYNLLNNPNRGAYSLVTDLDNAIPFVKVFIIPYIGWYLFLAATLIFLCWKDRTTYYKTLLTINIGMVICFVIYFVFQTTVPRPTLYGTDHLTQLVLMTYNSDAPYNCFPSIHSLTSFALIKGINSSKARTPLSSFIITLGALLIIVSTLMIKQHVVLDALASIVLVNLIYKFVGTFGREGFVLWAKKTALAINKKYVA